MPLRTKVTVYCLAYLMVAIVSSALLCWWDSRHNPSALDFAVVILFGLLCTFGLSTVTWLEGGITVLILCILFGVAEPLFEQYKMTSFTNGLYIAPLVSLIVSRVLYRLDRSDDHY